MLILGNVFSLLAECSLCETCGSVFATGDVANGKSLAIELSLGETCGSVFATSDGPMARA